MKWDRKEFKLIGQNGEIHDLGPHEFWYLAPAETNFQLHNATVPPLDYAILLHTARLGEGVVPPMRKLLEGLPRTTNKRGVAAQAEQLLEDIRNIHFPDLPSRLRCHFLNFDRVVAECRSNSMFRRKRILTPCYTILTDSSFHFADVEIYERLEGSPDDAALAKTYWGTFIPANSTQASSLEVLADCALYFPEWRSFPNLEEVSSTK